METTASCLYPVTAAMMSPHQAAFLFNIYKNRAMINNKFITMSS